MRVIIAARLSKMQKNGRPGIGIDTQDSRSNEYCRREGYDVVSVVADTKSGIVAPWDRPHLKPWVTQPELMSQYDAIVAYKNDRLSRGEWSDEARIRLWAEENKKRLIIVDGPQWPPRHDGDKWQWEAMAAQARKEWEDDRERSMRAQKELMDRGKLVGKAPFGYMIEGDKYDRRLVPTDEGRIYIPEIFRRYVAGESFLKIADWLNAEGVGNQTWWPRTLWTLIKSTTYIGRRQNKAGKTILLCEPLVDTALWKRAQLARSNSSRHRGPLNTENRALLMPLCPCCQWTVVDHMPNSPMYRVRLPQGGVYYRCHGRGASPQACGNLSDLPTVDRLVSDFLSRLDSPIYETRVTPGTNWQPEIADIEFELKALASQELSEEEEDTRREELRAERRRLQSLEPTADRVEAVDTGRTHGEAWGELSPMERRDWVTAHGIKCYPARTATGVAQVAFPDLLLRAMGAAALLEDDEVSVVLTWSGSGIE
jgi:DNA invertase Pin-like site-specific DNA recombinase